jgi:DNA helicase TIP49 (TBP-interacting protein)
VTATRTTTLKPHVSISIDSIADAAFVTQREAREAAELVCDACDAPLEGEPEGRGLLMWSRGDELRFEEPALCGKCAMAIGITALTAWSADEEEEG